MTRPLSFRTLRNCLTGYGLARRLLAAASLLLPLSGSNAYGQSVPPTQESSRLEVSLERRDGEEWRTTDPGQVLQQNDEVRFRVSGNFDGYLYVMNLNTSGQYGLIFPRDDTGQANKIETGKQYLIPATEGWFRITGPPGYEIVYWLVSPVELRHEPTDSKPSFLPIPAPQSSRPPAHLIPKCDDSIFKTRGDCIDRSAGAKGIGEAEKLPENLGRIAGAGRDLAFSRTENSTVIASPTSLKSPVIFVFRLAHR